MDNEPEIKIIQLKCLKQDLKKPYRTKVENYYPKDYAKAKKKVLAIDKYKREKDYSNSEDHIASEEAFCTNKSDIDIDSLEEYIIKDCLNCSKGPEQFNKTVKLDNVNIQMVKFTEINFESMNKYLKVELPIGKCKKRNIIAELPKQSNKKGRVSESIEADEVPKYAKNIIYILFTKLSNELNIFKKIANIEITINL
ncbi:22127_t:CDS:2 [Dentiscutata erythropus]|uniref:22127_t:CDS:1 n=1 Tax=Dentiscutata erythropus TaxID=1348616 RepID=A0A9N9DAL8_9GLOM|nr:22127_t:CDS:2 [Dentiscutata erythropus]